MQSNFISIEYWIRKMIDNTFINIESSKEGTEAHPSRSLPESIKARRREIKIEAMKKLRSKTLLNPEFNKKIRITGSGIDEWLNQPHKHYAEKNEALLSLERLMETSKYLGCVEDPRKRRDVLKCHLFEATIGSESSWIIVHEMRWGECLLHSVSEADISSITKSP